ncbi:hypothetical protein BB560_007045 [Smittium megazygosporum]|uniref:Major facilitator superfamily (MFS) profile domain-containing protein n=1 Tax=Smittium megazygosporum TaxID=133381 RepID=A0A2T9XZ63_9FUNG|nr:hypothetical protein BB560_007045 [Smittium megazygosporum]
MPESKSTSTSTLTNSKPGLKKGPKQILKIVIWSLVIDILAFTCILPLLPKTIESYRALENYESNTLLARILIYMQTLREIQVDLVNWLHPFLSFQKVEMAKVSESADIVLLGGMLGSLYSILQCIVAPIFGNIAWTVMWLFADNFTKFLVARVVAGLCEANLQLSTTIISDISKPESRTKQMAYVGISFSIGFTFGPAIGAYFASMGSDIFDLKKILGYFGISANLAPFSNAALFSLVLLIFETIYVYKELPETMGYFSSDASDSENDEKATHETGAKSKNGLSDKLALRGQETEKSKSTIKRVCMVYFGYMLVFSGMEYTLTFLMHNMFSYSNKQQGAFLGTIGLFAAIFQGFYLRRFVSKIGERAMVLQGFVGCIIGMFSVVLMASYSSKTYLNGVILGFSFASAIVTTTMNSIITLINAEGVLERKQQSGNKLVDSTTKSNPDSPSTYASRLGDFRSYGQLGRAFGPGIVSFVYWLFGPTVCYFVGALSVALFTLFLSRIKL